MGLDWTYFESFIPPSPPPTVRLSARESVLTGFGGARAGDRTEKAETSGIPVGNPENPEIPEEMLAGWVRIIFLMASVTCPTIGLGLGLWLGLG